MSPSRFTVLVDWIDGRLDADRARETAAYVAGADAETARALTWIREFVRAAGALELHQPPAELRARLRSLIGPAVVQDPVSDRPVSARSA